MVFTGEEKVFFTQGILQRNNNHVAADVFIYVFVNEATRESESESKKTTCSIIQQVTRQLSFSVSGEQI